MILGAPVSSVLAGDEFNPLGDGSGFNNADLVRDETTGCENCLPDPPHDWDDPWFDLDWALALRGAYVTGTSGSYIEAIAAPSVVLSHESLRGGYAFSADAEISRSTLEDVRVGAVRGGFSGDYKLDESTALAGAADFSLSQASAKAPGTDPNIEIQPLVFSGNAEASIARDFGPLVFTGTLDASRTAYGETTLVGPVIQDNTHQSNWIAGSALRVGYRVTPTLTAFVDGQAAYQWYDAPSPTLLVKLDAADYQVRTGLSANWLDVLEAETSIGYGLRQFAEPMLGATSAVLYDASLTFRPDETLEVRGAFATNFGAPGPDNGGTARLEYVATSDVVYTVNPWLKLRAAAGWSYAQLIGNPETDLGANAGVGADYLLNEFTSLTADYLYAWGQSTPNPPEESHTVTLGITFHD